MARLTCDIVKIMARIIKQVDPTFRQINQLVHALLAVEEDPIYYPFIVFCSNLMAPKVKYFVLYRRADMVPPISLLQSWTATYAQYNAPGTLLIEPGGLYCIAEDSSMLPNGSIPAPGKICNYNTAAEGEEHGLLQPTEVCGRCHEVRYCNRDCQVSSPTSLIDKGISLMPPRSSIGLNISGYVRQDRRQHRSQRPRSKWPRNKRPLNKRPCITGHGSNGHGAVR